MTLDSCRHVDRLPFREADNGFLVVAAAAAATPEHLHLALLPQRVDRNHPDLEQVLDRDLDFRLGGVEWHLEGDLVMLRAQRRLHGEHRKQDEADTENGSASGRERVCQYVRVVVGAGSL